MARSQLRGRRRASVVLAVFAGLATAAPMAVWSAGRHVATTVDRSLEEAGAADVLATVCPPGIDPDAGGDPTACFEYQPVHETEMVRSLPGVTAAARVGIAILQVGPSPDLGNWPARPVVSVVDTIPYPTLVGTPQVLSGRLATAEATDELMVNEVTARALGVSVGDKVWLQGAALSGVEAPPAEDAAAGATLVESRIVGIVRTPADLLPVDVETAGIPLHARAGWAQAHGHELPPVETVISVWLDDGDVEGFQARLQERLPDRAVSVFPALDETERSNLDQAAEFESRAALAVAAVAGIAVAFFVGQAVARQARAESADGPTLLALGMTRRQLAMAAVARWLPIALGAAAMAGVATAAASLFGPIGLARRASWEPVLRVDALVLVTGAVTTAVLVVLAGGILATRRPAEGAASRSMPAPVAVGSPVARAGVALGWQSFARGSALPVVSALVSAALAMAAVVTTAGGAESLRRVTGTPERFGVPWDAVLRGRPLPDQQDEMLTKLRQVPGVVSAAKILGASIAAESSDPGEGKSDSDLWVLATAPVEGIARTGPVITAGREPLADDEIALGSITMRALGVEVGDRISLQSQRVSSEPFLYRVVGVAMVTDGFEPNVGKGGLASLAGLQRLAAESDPDGPVDVAVRLVDGPGRAEAQAALRDAFPYVEMPFPVPTSLGNAERVAGLPMLLALVGAVAAAVTLSHALIVTVRRNRRELAVCRALGFTPGQVYGSVATLATIMGLVAAVAGALLGTVGARWGWRILAAGFGVHSGPVLPGWVVLVSAMTVVVVANLAAAAPGRAAARITPSAVLKEQ